MSKFDSKLKCTHCDGCLHFYYWVCLLECLSASACFDHELVCLLVRFTHFASACVKKATTTTTCCQSFYNSELQEQVVWVNFLCQLLFTTFSARDSKLLYPIGMNSTERVGQVSSLSFSLYGNSSLAPSPLGRQRGSRKFSQCVILMSETMLDSFNCRFVSAAANQNLPENGDSNLSTEQAACVVWELQDRPSKLPQTSGHLQESARRRSDTWRRLTVEGSRQRACSAESG